MLKDLKVVFMGTPDFSVPIFESLIENCQVLALVCQPDKVVGRHQVMVFPKTKEIALKHNIKVLQPVKIKDDYQEIIDLNPDIIITCAYGQIIPKVLLESFKYESINVHASLLPRLRGGAPIHHAIIDGYRKTGVTIMYMDTKMDSGDIISQDELLISDSDTYQTLHDKLSIMGKNLLIKTLPSIITKTNRRIKQDSNLVTFGYNITREEELIDFSNNMQKVYDKIRGLNPNPGAYFTLNGKKIKVYEAIMINDLSYHDNKLGEIVKIDKNGIYIKVLDGLIKLLDIQVEGKKRMPVSNFLNGNKNNLIGLVVGDNNEE